MAFVQPASSRHVFQFNVEYLFEQAVLLNKYLRNVHMALWRQRKDEEIRKYRNQFCWETLFYKYKYAKMKWKIFKGRRRERIVANFHIILNLFPG